MAELAGVELHAATDVHVAADAALEQVPLGEKVGLHRAVALEVVLGEVRPQHAVRAEVAQRLGLKGADLADGDRLGAAAAAIDDELRKGKADVARGGGVAPGGAQRVGEKLGGGGLAVGAGHRDDGPAPEQRREVQLAQAERAASAGEREPRVGGRETRGKQHQPVRLGLGGGEDRARAVGPRDVENHRLGPESRHQPGERATAHAAAEDGDGLREERANEVGRAHGVGFSGASGWRGRRGNT